MNIAETPIAAIKGGRPIADDGGGENQHRVMVDKVGGVDKADHPGRAVHREILGRILKSLELGYRFLS